MKLTTFAIALLLGLSPAAPVAAQSCAMSSAESAWVEKSLQAWRHVSTRKLNLPPAAQPTMILFNEKCRFERITGQSVWRAEPHNGTIRLPDGGEVPVQVTAFAGRNDRTAEPFFVMALPSVWEAAKVIKPGDANGLIGVFLHEFSHTRQTLALQPVFRAAAAVRPMPEKFSDDSLQEHFQDDPAYVAVFEKERDLLYRAAEEPDDAKAKALAREALALMEARQKRWFAGEDAWWKPYDDLWLTMEGFGQWVAYAWLSDPKGGGMTPAAARDRMRGSRRWWSQEEGLALFLVIDRFVPEWPAKAFAPKPALGIDLLREAVADRREQAGA